MIRWKQRSPGLKPSRSWARDAVPSITGPAGGPRRRVGAQLPWLKAAGAPGSAMPRATTIEEEGVYIDNFTLVDQGRFLEAETYALLTGARYPARSPAKNIADLKAHVAANAKGVAELEKMVAHFGLDVVRAYMGHVQDNAEEQVRRVLDVLKDRSFTYPTDQGAQVAVAIRIDKARRSAVVDFTGSSAQLGSNFNAPQAVCRAAVLYVFRTLVEDEIPMNEGCLKPLELVIPMLKKKLGFD